MYSFLNNKTQREKDAPLDKYPHLIEALNRVNSNIRVEWIKENATQVTVGFCEEGIVCKMTTKTINAYKDVAKKLKALSIGKVNDEGHVEHIKITIQREELDKAVAKLCKAYPTQLENVFANLHATLG